MNALWITRISDYKSSPHSIVSAKRLIETKIRRQNLLAHRYKAGKIATDFSKVRDITDVFLEEARAAKQFWSIFRKLVPSYAGFKERKAHAPDITNHLLDIGYHHLTNIVKHLLEAHDISPALGLMHVAHRTESAPLAYDLVELFRTDVVDTEVLGFLRLKKKPLATIGPEEISHFLHKINERLERQHYLKDFRQCHTYRYYMELQVLKFIKAVNHNEVFEPMRLPTRHEGRCRPTLTSAPVVVSSGEQVL